MLVDVLRPPAIRSLVAVRSELLIFAAIAAYFFANLPSLEAWPTAHNDEAREMNAFWVAARVDPRARGMDPEFGPDPLYKGGLQGLSVGLAFRFAGLGLFQGRLVSLLWGALLLGLVFLLGRRLYGPLAGALAVLFLALSRPFLLSTHLVRPDIVLAAMLAGAAYLAVRGVQQREPWSSLAAGLVLGLALDVHLNALAFLPLVGLIFVAYEPRWWRARSSHLFLLGLGLGSLYYLLVRVLPDPSHFAASTSYWIGIDKRPPLLSGDPGEMLASELGRFSGYFGSEQRLELLVLLAALMAAAVRAVASRRLDPVLLGLAGAFAFFVLFVGAKSEFYLILYYTWWTLLLAGMVGWLVVRLPRLGPAVAVLAVLLAPLVFGMQESYEDIQTAVGTYRERGYYALIGDIRAVVPPGATILAPPLYWIGLHDHQYTDYYVWERLRAERRERFSSFVARLKPDLVVLDAKSRHQVSINSPGFLEANATLLTTVRRVGFDRVEVWKLL